MPADGGPGAAGLGQDQWALVGERRRLVFTPKEGTSEAEARRFLLDLIERDDLPELVSQENGATPAEALSVPSGLAMEAEDGDFHPDCIVLGAGGICLCTRTWCL